MTAPVLFLAFANDTSAHLDLLKTESSEVWRTLADLDRQEFVKVHREESANVDELFGAFARFKDRVAIFHYGGHADGTMLQLEGGGGYAQGMAGLLGEQANLRLVFLNGCATRPQVEQLLAAGVKAVIATSVPIRDDKACAFSTQFYQALANRRTVGQAFALAQRYLETRFGDARGIGVVPMRDIRAKHADAGEVIPWGLYIREEAQREILDWTLPYYRTIGLPQDMLQYIGSSFGANRYIMLVLDELARYNPDIHAQMTEQRGGETVRRDSREYPELIVRNFPWPVGSQIRLLRLHDEPDADRLELLVSAYVRTTQLLYFILLSDLWEQRRRGALTVPRDMDLALPRSAGAFGSFDFLQRTLDVHDLFRQQGARPWVAEFERVADAWSAADGPLRRAHAYLEQLRAGLAEGTPMSDLAQRCLTSEQALSVVLRSAAFLARYRMITVRNITVEAPRFASVAYEVDMGPLNAVDNSALNLYQDSSRRRKAHYGNSHSIVLVRDENALDDCLNLSPFVVDKNTFVNVKKSETTEKDRLAHIFVLSYEEQGRLVYLSVDHGLRYALANVRDRIHTDMTREDFTEGRNLTPAAPAADPFGVGAAFGLEPERPAEGGVKVFQVLRDQLDGFVADIGTAP